MARVVLRNARAVAFIFVGGFIHGRAGDLVLPSSSSQSPERYSYVVARSSRHLAPASRDPAGHDGCLPPYVRTTAQCILGYWQWHAPYRAVPSSPALRAPARVRRVCTEYVDTAAGGS
jgi:hypothetical protein